MNDELKALEARLEAYAADHPGPVAPASLADRARELAIGPRPVRRGVGIGLGALPAPRRVPVAGAIAVALLVVVTAVLTGFATQLRHGPNASGLVGSPAPSITGIRPTPAPTLREGQATLTPLNWQHLGLKIGPEAQLVWGDAGFVLWTWSNELDYADQAALLVSSDGRTWTTVARFWDPRASSLRRLIALPGHGYVALLERWDASANEPMVEIWSSVDGRHWRRAQEPGFTDKEPVDVAALGGQLVLVANSYPPSHSYTDIAATVWTSTDGLDWTERATFPSFSATVIERLGSGLAVVGSTGGQGGSLLPLASSADGRSWNRAVAEDALPALGPSLYGPVGYEAGVPVYTNGAWRLTLSTFVEVTVSCPTPESCRQFERPVTTYVLSSNDLVRWNTESQATATVPPAPEPGASPEASPPAAPSGPTTNLAGVDLRAIPLRGPASSTGSGPVPLGAIIQQSTDGLTWTDLQDVHGPTRSDAVGGAPVALTAGPSVVVLVMVVTNAPSNAPIEIHSEIWVAMR